MPNLLSLSKAYAQNEWNGTTKDDSNTTHFPEQWIAPTSVLLQPGASQVFAYRIFLAASVRDKDAALAKAVQLHIHI